MTATPDVPTSPASHRLSTLGTLALAGRGDIVLESQGPQRRRLALLAVLAAAGERGRSRDQLMLLFWPDATQARARHSLEQLMYAIRSSVDKDVFVGVNPVRLNTEVIGSDVEDFNAAVERGDREAAVENYGGPFLDGFYLNDAPEFEQWVASERAQLAQSYVRALEQLAERAEAVGDTAAAASWWRKLSEVDPVSGTAAAGLMRALMSAGDHVAALRHAEQYESVVARELGTGVGPTIAGLVAEARAQSKTQPMSAARPAPPAQPKSHAPAGQPREESVAPVPGPQAAEPLPQQMPRRRAAPYVIPIAVLLAAIAASVAMWSAKRERTPPAAAQASIAVLPFANIGGNPEDEPVVDGLTEEMIGVLAKIENLRVISRTSAFAFRSSDAGVRRIADSLGVANVLEGSVQKSGSKVRVQVRLLDARDGSTRWSETYDRELRDIFSVQSDIAGAVARELDLRLVASTATRIKRGSTPNIAAYELYLRGSDRRLLRSDSAALVGLDYFRRATALDPNYAAAWAGLGRMYGTIVATVPVREKSRHYALAQEAARKAVSLDDSLAEAHATLGILQMARFDFPLAERHLTRAIALDPTSTLAHEWIVTLYLWKGRPAEALTHARHALALDPLSPYAHAEVARALLGSDRCEEALVHLDRLKRLEPPLRRAVALTALCHIRLKAWPEAMAAIRTQGQRGGGGLGLAGYINARSGQRTEALRIERELLDRSRRGEGTSFELALVRAGLGDFEQASMWLDRAITELSLTGVPGNPTHVGLMSPVFEDLRRHDSFEKIRRRMGLQNR